MKRILYVFSGSTKTVASLADEFWLIPKFEMVFPLIIKPFVSPLKTNGVAWRPCSMVPSVLLKSS